MGPCLLFGLCHELKLSTGPNPGLHKLAPSFISFHWGRLFVWPITQYQFTLGDSTRGKSPHDDWDIQTPPTSYRLFSLDLRSGVSDSAAPREDWRGLMALSSPSFKTIRAHCHTVPRLLVIYSLCTQARAALSAFARWQMQESEAAAVIESVFACWGHFNEMRRWKYKTGINPLNNYTSP